MEILSQPVEVDVLVAGGGPSGLMLAIELGRRGIRVLLVDDKSGTAFNPQANATQARTMEHYRRLGFAEEIRGLGLPVDYPTDIAYFTRFTDRQISRFSLPPSGQSGSAIRQATGRWSAAELPHRVSQKFVEPVLLRHAQENPSVEVRFQWRLAEFADREHHVEAVVESLENGEQQKVKARFLVGADGARSMVRRGLGIELGGETVLNREMLGGQMLAVYVRVPDFYKIVSHPLAWMYCTFNTQRRSFMAAVDGKQDFAFHTQIRPGEIDGGVTDDLAKDMFLQAMGQPIDVEVLSHGMWTAGYALVAERMRVGNVLISGDAAHLFTPAGGLGYNTAVEDSVNLGWKLASIIKGQGGPGLIESYNFERRRLAIRNTGFARWFADSIGLYFVPPEIEDNTAAGEEARRKASAYFNEHTRKEFDIPGVTFGGRYDSSPIIVGDDAPLPPDSTESYTPTAKPGGRPPHAWLDDGSSLFDHFGTEWTLLRLGPSAPSASGFVTAALKADVELVVVSIGQEGIRELYEAQLALIRPDQIVAWRGESDEDAVKVLEQVMGKLSIEHNGTTEQNSLVLRKTSI